MSNRLSIIVLCAFLAWMSSLFAEGLGNRTSAQRFSTHGLDKDGTLRWVLEGESVNFKGNVMELKDDEARVIEVKNCRAVFHGTNGKEFTLMTPSCNVLMALRELKSDSVLQFTTNGFEGSGIGYDVNLEERIVRLRSTVHISIKHKAGLLREKMEELKANKNKQE